MNMLLSHILFHFRFKPHLFHKHSFSLQSHTHQSQIYLIYPCSSFCNATFGYCVVITCRLPVACLFVTYRQSAAKVASRIFADFSQTAYNYKKNKKYVLWNMYLPKAMNPKSKPVRVSKQIAYCR